VQVAPAFVHPALGPPSQLGGLGPLLRSQEGLDFLVDGAPRQHHLEAGGRGLVKEGPKLGFGGGCIPRGGLQGPLGLLDRIAAKDQILVVPVANGLDARLLGIGQVQGLGHAFGTRAVAPSMGRHGKGRKGQEKGGPKVGFHECLLGWGFHQPRDVRHGTGGRVESRQTEGVIRTYAAIVLKAVPYAEGGAVVSFLSEHGERLSGVAKGVKKPTAKWVAAFEPMGLVRVSFFGKEHMALKRVTGCELSFSPLTLGHLESSLVMACLADLFDRVAREGVEDDRLFRLLSACGRALKADPDNALGILAYAEHWLLHCMGLLPHPRTCGRCGQETAPIVMLSPETGWCCAACTPVDPQESLPPGCREHLRLLRTGGADVAPRVDASNEPQAAITALLRARLLQELGGLRSYDVLWRTL